MLTQLLAILTQLLHSCIRHVSHVLTNLALFICVSRAGAQCVYIMQVVALGPSYESCAHVPNSVVDHPRHCHEEAVVEQGVYERVYREDYDREDGVEGRGIYCSSRVQHADCYKGNPAQKIR